MSPTEQQVKRIQEKVQQLIRNHQLLQQENEQLKKEMRTAIERQELYKSKIDTLEERVAALQIATGQLNEPDKKEVEKRLNHYLKEIDRCISMLSE
jgi:vacuolar-type H+-ATPase subunit D/Vma8